MCFSRSICRTSVSCGDGTEGIPFVFSSFFLTTSADWLDMKDRCSEWRYSQLFGTTIPTPMASTFWFVQANTHMYFSAFVRSSFCSFWCLDWVLTTCSAKQHQLIKVIHFIIYTKLAQKLHLILSYKIYKTFLLLITADVVKHIVCTCQSRHHDNMLFFGDLENCVFQCGASRIYLVIELYYIWHINVVFEDAK